MSHQAFILLVVCLVPSTFGLLDWIFGSDTSNNDGKLRGLIPKNANFEMQSTDEQFLTEFSKYLMETEMESQLGLCFHKVIYRYTAKRKCSQMIEEEMSKLAVHLLNCQSQSENRPIFTCTDTMTLGQCTENMDGSTWNAYHLMNNRARAMCYATQQQHFRKMTEMAVTKLALSAKSQLQAMDNLEKGQETLHSLTTDTVQKLYESQQDLLGTHRELQIAHQDVMEHVSSNIDNLMKEKSLIAAGNKELADMTESIKNKLELTTSTLTEQDSDQKKNHRQIMEDLNGIHVKAQEALSKLDNSSKYFLKNHKEMMVHYQLLYENIIKINSTVENLLSTVSAMQEKLDKKIGWFTHILGATDEKLSFLLVLGQHIGYFLVMALVVSFLQIPRFSRLTMLMGVIASSILELQFECTIGFQQLTAFCLAIIGGNCLYHIWRQKNMTTSQRLFALKDTTHVRGDNSLYTEYTVEDLRELNTTLQRLSHSLNDNLHEMSLRDRDGQTPVVRTPENNIPTPRPDSSTMPDDLEHVRRYINELDDRLSTSSRPSATPIPSTSFRHASRSSTPLSTTSSRCIGTTRSGTPCRLQSPPGHDFCHRHRQGQGS
ncbi:protein brambleberry-like [Mizuhopecten yessoensis]|uniref:Protein brambleberry n=1 Tax=Mizuhopecten yessoensis TaxID=6573 RepID=A0A210PTM9_MIZYE|nr:protein brambleberry-like [Mizuhopecten yessoensis]OWF39851.1 Protein brambleberry [Mizuhopecten yessoensis]